MHDQDKQTATLQVVFLCFYAVFDKIDARFFGHLIDPFEGDGLQGLGGNFEAHIATLLRVPDFLPLQVYLLEFLGATMGEGDRKAIVGAFSSQHAAAGHKQLLRQVEDFFLLMTCWQSLRIIT
jgi:hypothetical protein